MGFNRYTAEDITTKTTVVTCPAGKVITVIGVGVANVSGTTSLITVELNNAKIVKDASVFAGSSIVPVGGEQKLVMVAGDTLSVTSDYAVDTIVSVLEQTV